MKTLNLKQMILDKMTWQEAKEIVTEYLFTEVCTDIIRCGEKKSKIIDTYIHCQDISYEDYQGKHEIEVELTLSELLHVACGTHKKEEDK